MRIVFSVEYDGSSFCGWQHQPSECSLQDVIQNAIKKFSGQPIKIIGSSRTDSESMQHGKSFTLILIYKEK